MTTKLDLDEIFHLAIHASKNGDHEKAILYLKEGAEKEGSARFHYLLGAQYAELGMYPRAIECIEKTLEIDPNIPEASFQLGLLWAMLNDADKAKSCWNRLDELGDDNHIYMFKTAILLAGEKDYKKAVQLAEGGMKKNIENLPLNGDMENLVVFWKKQLEFMTDEPLPLAESGAEQSNYFLSAYQDKGH